MISPRNSVYYPVMIEIYITPEEVCLMLGVKPNTLHVWRKIKRYPELKYIKADRMIRYKKSAVENFIKKREK